MNTDEPKRSEFNAGIAKLMRIDFIKRQAFIARTERSWPLWGDCLAGFRSEMSDRMDKEQGTEADKYEQKIDNYMANDEGQKLVYSVLNKYEIFLNKLEYKFGLGMPDKDDDEGL